MEGIRKFSKVSLAVALLLSVFLGYLIKDLRFDYDFEAFFPENDPETKFFEAHRKRFESDNDFVFIAIQNKPSVFEASFLQKVDQFADSLANDTLVREVQCLTNMSEYIKTPFSPLVFEKPYLNPYTGTDFTKDSTRIFKKKELVGFFINQKADALLLFVKHQQYMSKRKCDQLKADITNLLDFHGLKDYKIAGRAVGLGYYIDKMQYETGLFIGLSFILVIAFLALTFKSFWGVWVPLTIVTLSMVWVVGFMVLVNQPINLVLTVLPSIIFVVAMSDVIHLVSKFLDEIRTGKTKTDAVKTAYKEVGLATLMTSVTTAIGFITLLTVNMEPVKDFGIYTAIGVMLAFTLAYTVLPGLLLFTKTPKIADTSLTDTAWYKILHKLFRGLIRKRRQVFMAFLVTAVISLIGVFFIKANYFLLEDISEDSTLRQDYEYFDNEFMGLRPFEMAVIVKDSTKTIYDYDVICEMAKLENYLTENYGLRQCFSLVSVLKIANRAEHGGQDSYFTLPDSADTKKFIYQIQTFDKKNQMANLVDSTSRYGRISSTIGDIGLYAIREKNAGLNAFIEVNIDHSLVEFKMTGTGHLLDLNMSYLSKNLLYGLLISVGLIGLIMGLLYRSVKMVIIALAVNILPLLMIAALLGFAGVDLKVSTAIIFTISFGIAVDDTLHFMSRFKMELKRGKSYLYALKRTFLSTGKAIVLTSVILCAGFLLLLFSDFLGTFYVGLLISLTLLFALLADLFLLPVLLMIFYRKPKA
ncbi:MAG: MMPL family transporter [Bacteroidetes bacterium]|nr:MMPL family transporter [Bacteroidota bacterium]